MKINPAILRQALLCKDTPVLLYDFEKIEENLRSFRKVTQDTQATWSYAVKSFAHSEIIELAKHFVDGFDISNKNEWLKIEASLGPDHTVWLTNANLHKELDFFKEKIDSSKLIVTINDLTDYKIIKNKMVDYVIRISSREIVDQSAYSRFGFSLKEIQELENEILTDHYFKGFHVHQGLQEQNPKILKGMLQSIIEKFTPYFKRDLYFNLGGGLQHFSETELQDAFIFLKDKFRIHIEPGRAIVKQAGFAMAPIEKYILDGGELRLFTRLSFLSHLKWSTSKMAGILNDSNQLESFKPDTIVLEGPSCYEFDKSNPFTSEDEVHLAIGSIVLLSEITGYSSEWNTSFNGVPAAEVKFVGRKLRSNP
jgi:diaminopimelate decarboxylase